MNALEGRLDPEKFFRIHRSRIVNMERIQELQPWLNGEYSVLLRTGTRLTLSRGYREKLQERIDQFRDRCAELITAEPRVRREPTNSAVLYRHPPCDSRPCSPCQGLAT